ncbi:MAG: acyl-ACP--UDP-N-acetylglucosamine O-acyltransferase [Hyphomicrobiales bacterium]|nr:acyl-ACP--UDP-N-acetylglucosamine O-acyltransferase [Hyphomicrobiales bacterium]
MADIHPTAQIAEGARLGDNVRIGPFCVIGPNVVLEDGVVLESHVVITGNTTIGTETHIYPFASLGYEPQYIGFHGEDSQLVIGARNTIREYVTMNPGTQRGGLVTTVGDDCLFMVNSHVAHDCHVGNNVIFVNNATLGGHCTIGNYVMLGGLSAVHQFVRIGDHAFVGGMSGVEYDVIPFGSVLGNRAHLGGLNIVGMKRRGFDREQIHTLRTAYRLLFSNEGTLRERLEDVAEMYAADEKVMTIVEFIRADSARALCTPRNGG